MNTINMSQNARLNQRQQHAVLTSSLKPKQEKNPRHYFDRSNSLGNLSKLIIVK